MSVECFRPRHFREASLSLITALRDIASDYAADGMRLTVRQLYYQCVARGWIENNEREYQKIIRLLTDAREAGLFDWDAIEDRGREVVMRPCWRSPAEILKAAASSYHEDRWGLQDVRVVVVLEKAALAGIVEPACTDLDTPLLAARGYSSATLFYEVAKKWIGSALEAGQDAAVLHLGDHDPSGLDMTRDLRDRLSLYARTEVDVRRVALNMDQVEAFQPPPNPAKESDKRFDAYRRDYGAQCWELDALPPEELARLTREAIEEHIDWRQWAESTTTCLTKTNGKAGRDGGPGAVAKVKPIDSEVKERLARAKMAIRPEVRAAFVISEFGGHQDVAALAVQLEIGMNDVSKNGLRQCEEMLYCQARALQTIFETMARQVPTQESFSNPESFMRLALKAQNQCRMTVETLATIKNPPVVFARQANIAQGHQQVNNGMMPAGEPRAGAGENEKPQNKLLEAQNGERLDFGAPGAAVGADPQLAAVGGGDGAEVRRG